MNTRAWSAPLLVVLFVSSGCGDSVDVFDPGLTAMTIEATPRNMSIGTEVSFRVVATNNRIALITARIDFEDDGTWDETRDFNHTEISTTFTHTYTHAGTFTARSEVVDAAGRPTRRDARVTVTDPSPFLKVRFGATPSPVIAGTHPCYADGPPATTEGSMIPVPSSTRTLGPAVHGENVSVSQEFRQGPPGTDQIIRFSCTYDLTLFVEENGLETPIGQGSCATMTGGAGFACTATASGVVP